MALSRLIQQKSMDTVITETHLAKSGLSSISASFHVNGFPKPVRWFCSHSSDSEVEKPSQMKKKGVTKDQRAGAVESYVKKYMERNPGFFPMVAHIQNEVGGSWYTVKEIFNNLKEKMLDGTQPEDHHNDIDFHGDHNSTLKVDRAQQDVDKEGDVGHSTGMAEAECSACLTDPTSSDVAHMHNSTQCLDQQESRTTCSLSPDSSVEMNTMSGTPGAHIDGEEVSEAKNRKAEPAKVLSDLFIGFGKDKNPQVKSPFSNGIPQRSNSFSKRPEFPVNMSVSSSSENQPRKEMVASSQARDTVSNIPKSFTGSENLMGLEDMKGLNTRASELITDKTGYNSMHSFFRYFDKHKQKDDKNRDEIKGLMDCIKGLSRGSSVSIPKQNTSSRKTHESCEKSQLGIQSMETLRSFDKKERNVSDELHARPSKSNRDGSREVLPKSLRTPIDRISSPDFTKPTEHLQLSVPNDKEESHEKVDKSSSMEETVEYKAVVKFLVKTVDESHIVESFKKCGGILKVKISPPEEAFYRNADIHFESRKGLLNALATTDILVKSANITVEAAGEDISNRITIPSLIGDPVVPAAVVKNPTRTVKISQLTHEISSHDVVSALGSQGNNVTGFFFGTLDSVAYVEFDDVDDKETVLTKHSIVVRGKKLLISRIDVPRTTAVRISPHHPEDINKILKVCNSLGKTMKSIVRNACVVDVHFKIAEWPNMLEILNRLNGTKVDGYKLQAQPAPVIPPQILQILWTNPDERIHVRNCVSKLLQRLGDHDELTDLADLPNFY